MKMGRIWRHISYSDSSPEVSKPPELLSLWDLLSSSHSCSISRGAASSRIDSRDFIFRDKGGMYFRGRMNVDKLNKSKNTL